MSRQTLKDAHYRVIGFIDTSSNGDQTAFDPHYRIVGFYRLSGDRTEDAHYRLVGFGNMLASLLRS